MSGIEAPLERIAIVGMAGRFPDARDVDELWRNVRDGRESITFFRDDELAAAGVPPELRQHPNYVPAGGVLEDIEWFDAEFFALTPGEAELMDPQHRLFLECCWQACEHAGYDPLSYPGRIGVYGGSASTSYFVFHILPHADLTSAGVQVKIFNDKDFLTTQVSYRLNLRGPSVAVQTACSTALVAVHLACQAVLNGECEMALAGGSTVNFPHRAGYLFQEGGIASPDGHCRAFDARAQGTVQSSGAGVVLLKRLADAVADGDSIHAVILGSAINNDGAGKAGFTAPGVGSQVQAVGEAMAIAGVDPETVGYIEAHGSGTLLGDPVEIEALARAFRASTQRRGFCAVGSIKTNFGHTSAAAGAAGLLKTVQALKHRQIPPSLHLEEPNPLLRLAESPFYLNARLRDWPANGTPRRAGVNSLGLGGTNAHVVLEEAPLPGPGSPSRPWQLLLVSARSASALDAATARLADWLRESPEANVADVAYTLQTGRHGFAHRRASVCRGREEALAALAPAGGASPASTGVAGEGERGVAFLLPGTGDHYAGMGAELYRREPCFREAIDRCAEALRPHLEIDLREVLYPAGGAASAGPRDLRRLLSAAPEDEDAANLRLGRTALVHPAVFAVDYALASLWQEWGIRPWAMIGYSLGEYVAACLAGVLSLEDALAVVAERARLVDELPAGAMLAVPLPEGEIEPLLAREAELSACAVNGPGLSVVGGPPAAVARVERRLADRGVSSRRLRTRHAFHSRMMEPVLGELSRLMAGVALAPPKIPFISNTTGTWITDREATDPGYWAQHLRRTVRFGEGLETLMARGAGGSLAVLEVGPGQLLGTLAKQHPCRAAGLVTVASLPGRSRISGPEDEQAQLLGALGRLWLAGVAPDWSGFARRERRRRLPLPTYPFERQRFLLELGAGTAPATPLLEKRAAMADWFYQPVWEQPAYAAAGPAAAEQQEARWLLFLAPAGVEGGIGARIAERLEGRGCKVDRVVPGEGFAVLGEGSYVVHPGRPEDYGSLLRHLAARGALPGRIAHFWSLSSPAVSLEESQERGFYSLLWLAQALGEIGDGGPDRRQELHLAVVANGLYEVTGAEALRPEIATLLGPCRVAPQELPFVTCSAIDVVLPQDPADDAGLDALASRLSEELTSPEGAAEPEVALRGRYRWVRRFRPVHLESAGSPPARLRQGGAYLLAGGLGEIGVELAEHLFHACGAKVALLVSGDVPPRDRWRSWLRAHDDDEELAGRMRRILALEGSGCEVLVAPVDLRQLDQLAGAVTQAGERFGAIHGVVQAAFVAGSGLLQWKSRDQAAAVLAPAVRNTQMLAEATRGLGLDFFVLCGSNTAVLGGAGQVDTCAAAAFLDAFAQARAAAASPGEPFVQVIDWGAFRWQPAEAGDPDLSARLRAGLDAFGIASGECREAWQRALATPLPRIVVSTRDLEAVREQVDSLGSSLLAGKLLGPQGLRARGAGHARPELAAPYVEPSRPVERRVASVWEEVLGIDGLGADDDFFELSGNSLLAIQIVSRLSAAFAVELTVATLLANPTIAALACRIEETRGGLAEGSWEGAPAVREASAAPPPGSFSIPPRNLPGPSLLSIDQERLWRTQQRDLSSPIYNIYQANRIQGPLSVPGLAAALAEVVRRHEALRTSFPVVEGGPVQEIAPRLAVDLPVIDLRGLPPGRREAEAERAAGAAVREPFDLTHPPLLRMPLVRLYEEDFVWVMAIHHLITDRISSEVRFEEIAELYQASSSGLPSRLPEPPFQFADFAVWQRQCLCAGDFDESLAWWRSRLAGAPEFLPLPADRPRPPVPSGRGARRSLVVSKARSAGLRALAQREGVTLFVAGLAVWKALLVRLTGAERLIVGTPMDYRQSSDMRGVQGFFLNQLCLDSDLSGDPPFRTVLRRVNESALGAYAHRDFPFTRLVDELLPEPDPSRFPFTQAVFLLIEPPQDGFAAIPGATVRPYWVDALRTQYDSMLAFNWVEGSGLVGFWEYSTELFDAATIDRMAEQFRAVLGGVVANPEDRLWDLPLLSPAQRHQLLAEWSLTAASGGLVHLLDPCFQPVPPGSVGEVCHGGTAAGGEAGAPGLAADRCVPDTLSGVPGARLFRTGELARYRSDGRLEPRGAVPGRSLESASAAPDAAELAAIEERLAGLWSRDLASANGSGRIEACDDFFRLGGDSLLAVRLASRVREAFGVDFPLERVFRRPTLAAQAREIAESRLAASRQPPPIERTRREAGADLELSFAQQRLWVFDQLEPGSTAYNNTYGVRLAGPLDVAALERTLGEILRRHEVLRTSYAVEGGRAVQRVAPAQPPRLPIVDLGALGERERERELQTLSRRELMNPFDLACGPVLRALLVRLDERNHVMLFSLHHIASDIWSMGPLVREVAALYEAFAAGKPSPLPELPVQYADFAQWQRQCLRGSFLEAQLSYWERRLAGELPELHLPGARMRSGPPKYQGAKRSFLLPPALSRAVQDLSRREGATLFMTLAAGFAAWLYRTTAQADLVIGTTIASRNRIELEDLIGCFVNILPLRLDLSGNPPFRELLERVRVASTELLAHQDLPLESLMSRLRSERLRRGQPLFDLTFGLNRLPLEGLELPGLSLSPIELHDETARFDLSLWVVERKGGLEMVWTFRTDVFDETTVEHMNAGLEQLLAGAVRDPGVRIDRLDMITLVDREEQERQQRQQAELATRKLLEIGAGRRAGRSL